MLGLGASRPLRPWAMAGLVVLAIGLLHLGLALVLTRGARAEVAALRARWTEAELEQARAPGPAPESLGAGYAAWMRARDLHADAQQLATRQGHVQWLQAALAVSFAVQAVAVMARLARAPR